MTPKTLIRFSQFFSVLAFLILSVANVCAQGKLSELQQDFPKLLDRYEDNLDTRNAHYIFAIDISSSMRQYEATVRQSMLTFIDALPDGDQISIIVMADENNTGFLNGYRCRTIDSNSKSQLTQTIASLQFLNNGNPKDGSDGFTMTKKIIEAMDVTGSSDMSFVYMLTDFEYWTHKNRFNKKAEDWTTLQLPTKKVGQGMMCKYGIELVGSNTIRSDAVFKSELDRIFGFIDYQNAQNANDLAAWFAQVQNKVREHKMYALLKQEWQGADNYSIVQEGNQLKVVVSTVPNDFLQSYGAVVKQNINENVVLDTVSTSAVIGTLEKKKSFFPYFIRIDSTDIDVSITYQSKFIHRDTINHKDIDEVAVLQSQCESDSIKFLIEKRTIGIPPIKLWNSYIPMWAWIAIAILFLTIIISIIWECSQHPELQSLDIDVQCKTGNRTTQRFKGDTVSLPYSVGADADLQVPNVAWRLIFKGKRYNPIFNFVRRTGCYATLESGDFADIVDDITDNKVATLSVGSTKRIFKYKKVPSQHIEIEDGITKYIITIS